MRVILALAAVAIMTGTLPVFAQQLPTTQADLMKACNSEITAAQQRTRDERKNFLADCFLQKTRGTSSGAATSDPPKPEATNPKPEATKPR